MAFPEFDAGKAKLLFFSRGRGRGHAIPDIEIVRSLLEIRPDIEVRFVSYGLGADTLTAAGFPVIDVGLPEVSPIAEMTAISGKLIAWLNPDLVVAHEEFPVAPVAKIFDKRVVFVTDFFTEPDMYSMSALKFADDILFTGREGVFAEPPWVRGKVHYVGPVLRSFVYQVQQKDRAREQLGIAPDTFVICVFPGSWNESQAPALQLVLAAYDALDNAQKKLIWVAGADYQAIKNQVQSRTDVTVLDFSLDIERVMGGAADIAITKTNRMSIFELNALGVPVIALSWELNLLDDQAIAGLNGVERILARDATPRALGTAMERMTKTPQRPALPFALTASDQCAELLSKCMSRCEYRP